jgi:hypothetical protein
VGDVVLQWLVSASTCICAQSNREVHRASTSDGISGGQPNRVQPRRTAQKKTTSQFTSSCFGLVHGSGKWHKEHALSNHAKSEPSRVGRDWPVMSATLTLGLFHDCPYPTAIVHIRSFEPLFVGHRRTNISHPTYTVQFYILVESLPDAPSGGFDA